jgi:hypothetical protein
MRIKKLSKHNNTNLFLSIDRKVCLQGKLGYIHALPCIEIDENITAAVTSCGRMERWWNWKFVPGKSLGPTDNWRAIQESYTLRNPPSSQTE